jgi:hypothetical protein
MLVYSDFIIITIAVVVIERDAVKETEKGGAYFGILLRKYNHDVANKLIQKYSAYS